MRYYKVVYRTSYPVRDELVDSTTSSCITRSAALKDAEKKAKRLAPHGWSTDVQLLNDKAEYIDLVHSVWSLHEDYIETAYEGNRVRK